MRTFRLNKLVRDKILPDMQANGRQQVVTRTLDDGDYLRELKKKLLEETNEFSMAEGKEALIELADVLEVVETLADAIGSDVTELRKVRAIRSKARGGFKDRTYVETVTVADDDEWADYYAKDPAKYHEINGAE